MFQIQKLINSFMHLSIHFTTTYDYSKNTPRIKITKICFILHLQCYIGITVEQGGTRVFYMELQ